MHINMREYSDLKIFGKDLKILPMRELGGSDPNFTGDLSTEEFLADIRGD